MRLQKIVLGLCFLSVIFIFSGCATYSFSNTGEKFYLEDTPNKSKSKVYNWLKVGMGHLKKDDLIKKFGLPTKERLVHKPNFSVFGWMHAKAKSKSLDLGIYKYSEKINNQYMLSVVLDENGYLDNFEIELNREPSSTNMFTTRLIVDVAIYYFHIQQLENLMTRALNSSIDRFYSKLKSDVGNIGENVDTKEIKIKIDELRDEVSEK